MPDTTVRTRSRPKSTWFCHRLKEPKLVISSCPQILAMRVLRDETVQSHPAFLNEKCHLCHGPVRYSRPGVVHQMYPISSLLEKRPSILWHRFLFQVEQLLAGHEDSHGNVNYEEFVRTVMSGWEDTQKKNYCRKAATKYFVIFYELM